MKVIASVERNFTTLNGFDQKYKVEEGVITLLGGLKRSSLAQDVFVFVKSFIELRVNHTWDIEAIDEGNRKYRMTAYNLKGKEIFLHKSVYPMPGNGEDIHLKGEWLNDTYKLMSNK